MRQNELSHRFPLELLKLTIASLTGVALLAAAATAAAAERTVLVLDASGSMWGQIDGTAKISIAREVIGNLLDELPADMELGLFAYGHRRKGDCADIESLVPAGTDNRERIREAVQSLNPKGKTPLSDAVTQAAESLRYEEDRATVVLISDGIETCDRDPCATGAALEAAGVDFTAHVVGFDVAEPEAQAQLRCLADTTGGRFLPASDAAGLQAALGEVTAVVPEEPEYPAIVLSAPDTATVGDEFDVMRDTTVSERDYIAVVPAGADDDEYGNYARTGAENVVTLRAPGTPGAYEIRYIVDATRDVIARKPIELVDAQVMLEAPETVTAGSVFEVMRDRTVHGRDLVTIVPADAGDDELGNSVRARDDVAVDLTAPAEPGLYEIRYVLDEGRRVIGRRAVEVLGAEMILEAPASVTAGSRFEVARSGTVNERDLVTIVPVEAKENELGNSVRTRGDLTVALTAPAQPGLYEVRYVLDEGRRVLARRPVEVTGAEMILQAPASVTAGSRFEVTRGNTVNPQDLVTIVPVEAKDNELGNSVRARDDLTVALTAPPQPGLYEVRYVLNEGRRTIGRQAVEVTSAEMVLESPASVVAGSRFEVTRGNTVNPQDMITIVPVEAKDDQLGNSVRARDSLTVALTAPTQPGLYEVRYVLNEGRRTIARQAVEVTAPQVALKVPATAMAGGDVDVGLSMIVNPQDYIVVAPMGSADDEVPLRRRVRNDNPLPMTAPDSPGLYEVRYVLEEGNRVVARAPLEITPVSAGIVVPPTVTAGADFTVSWTGPNRRGDRIELAVAGTDAEPVSGLAATARGEARIQAPTEAGLYVVRYRLGATGEVAAETPFEVIVVEASITAPTSAAPGAPITVSWTGPAGAQDRVAMARPEQSDFQWIEARKVSEGAQLSFVLPGEPGVVEFRYLDVASRTVPARTAVEVR